MFTDKNHLAQEKIICLGNGGNPNKKLQRKNILVYSVCVCFFFFVDISKKNFSQVNCLDKSTKELSFTARFQQLQMKQEEHNV